MAPKAAASIARPTSDTFDTDELNAWLQQLHDRSPVYVHPRLVSFKNGTMKANWAPYFEGFERRDNLSGFLKADLGGKKMGLALCATWTRSWVGQKREMWTTQGWHMWAMALVARPQGYGKSMLIWDCDLDLPQAGSGGKFAQHAKGLAMQSQRAFVDATKAGPVALRSL